MWYLELDYCLRYIDWTLGSPLKVNRVGSYTFDNNESQGVVTVLNQGDSVIESIKQLKGCPIGSLRALLSLLDYHTLIWYEDGTLSKIRLGQIIQVDGKVSERSYHNVFVKDNIAYLESSKSRQTLIQSLGDSPFKLT